MVKIEKPLNDVPSTFSVLATDLFQSSKHKEGFILKNNVITYKEGASKGFIESPLYRFPQHKEIVLSWNMKVSLTTHVKVYLCIYEGSMKEQVLMAHHNNGKWYSEPDIVTPIGKRQIDTFLRTNPGQSISFKILCSSGNFSLKNVSISTRLDNTFHTDLTVLEEIDLPVPQKAQLPIQDIGHRICSPTSLTMVLRYYHIPETIVECAKNVHDASIDIYGNWSFNASYAGTKKQLYSKVEFIHNTQTLLHYLKQNIPIILSIQTKNKDDLIGSSVAYTNGHLVVLRGFTKKENKWFAIVNDPAINKDELVNRLYEVHSFFNSLKGVAYIVSNKPFI
jgi:hypothetical protein